MNRVNRPWPALGFGWILALIVLLVALGTALGVVSGAHLLWWLIALLALAILI